MPHASGETLTQTFSRLFGHLRDAEYAWQPVVPERLRQLRAQGEAFDPLTRFLGLGLEVSPDELLLEGLPEDLLDELLRLRPGVSRSGDVFVPHAHWPAPKDAPDEYVYIGQESLELVRLLQPHLPSFSGARVLDLGSGSGILSFSLVAHAKEVIGIESSRAAVDWASAAARAQGLPNLSFHHARIGTPEADRELGAGPWDFAVFNPPMAIPVERLERPHRDGGRLGVEIPLLFLDFAFRHIRVGGEVFCLVTNPIVRGASALFDRLERERWRIISKRCLNPRFNQELARKEGYLSLGVERVELHFLHLRKLS